MNQSQLLFFDNDRTKLFKKRKTCMKQAQSQITEPQQKNGIKVSKTDMSHQDVSNNDPQRRQNLRHSQSLIMELQESLMFVTYGENMGKKIVQLVIQAPKFAQMSFRYQRSQKSRIPIEIKFFQALFPPQYIFYHRIPCTEPNITNKVLNYRVFLCVLGLLSFI